MHDLRTIFVESGIHRALETRAPSLECPGCDVVLQEFFVDDVDDGWDESFDVFGTSD